MASVTTADVITTYAYGENSVRTSKQFASGPSRLMGNDVSNRLTVDLAGVAVEEVDDYPP